MLSSPQLQASMSRGGSGRAILCRLLVRAIKLATVARPVRSFEQEILLIAERSFAQRRTTAPPPAVNACFVWRSLDRYNI